MKNPLGKSLEGIMNCPSWFVSTQFLYSVPNLSVTVYQNAVLGVRPASNMIISGHSSSVTL